MTVQFIDVSGKKHAIMPVADYERLLAIAEENADIRAAVNAQLRREGGEDYLPAAMVDRLMAGESALRVWRKYRGKTLKQIADDAGIGAPYLSDIETGKRKGKPKVWRELAKALNVSVDDIMPD